MDFRLPKELEDLRRRTATFVKEVLIPLEMECETQGSLTPERQEEVKAKAQAAGLYAGNMPKEFGGLGLGALAQMVWQEELGKSTNGLWGLAGGPANVLIHCTERQREKYLLPVIAGEKSDCYAITEPGAGSDTSLLKATAERRKDRWILNGVKWFVTGGETADFVLVQAVTDPGSEKNRTTLFLVDMDTAGIRFGHSPEFMHTVYYKHPEVIFENVEVPEENVLGGVGRGMEMTREWFREERLHIAARCVGAAERMLKLATDWAKNRVQFGQPIAAFQAIQWMLVDSANEILAARLMNYRTGWGADNGADDKEVHFRASQVKLFASEMVNRVADRAVQIFGGRGYMRENPVERFYREVRVDRIWEGTSEIQRLIIGRALLTRGPDYLIR
ncbi:MAG: acyl-CoA dehydrogenase family protein [Acidobacteriota bacterium]